MRRTCLEVKCRDATFSDNYGNQFNRVGMCLNSDSVKVRLALAVWPRIMTALVYAGARLCHVTFVVAREGDSLPLFQFCRSRSWTSAPATTPTTR